MSEIIDQSSENVQIGGLPVDYKALMEAQVAALGKRTQPAGGDKISLAGKVFTFPDGKKTDEAFNAVIVDFVASNDFYENGFDKDDITPPNCFARGLEPQLLIPSAQSPDKQADSCAVCPNNQWGSGARGKGKACKNQRILAVLPPDATPESPIWILQASPTAVGFFDKYINGLASQLKVMPWGVISTIGFDTQSDYPSIRFGQPTPMSPQRALEFYARQEEARRRLLQEPDVSGFGVKAVASPKSLRRR